MFAYWLVATYINEREKRREEKRRETGGEKSSETTSKLSDRQIFSCPLPIFYELAFPVLRGPWRSFLNSSRIFLGPSLGLLLLHGYDFMCTCMVGFSKFARVFCSNPSMNSSAVKELW